MEKNVLEVAAGNRGRSLAHNPVSGAPKSLTNCSSDVEVVNVKVAALGLEIVTKGASNLLGMKILGLATSMVVLSMFPHLSLGGLPKVNPSP
jgi:hypothetical protein